MKANMNGIPFIFLILNSIVYHLEAEESYSTEIMKSAIVADSEKTVKHRIARLKQVKDNKT